MNTLHDDLVRKDIAHLVHPYTNLAAHEKQGPFIADHGEGVYVYDDAGRKYLEGMSGLWCASLGFSEQRLAAAAARQFEQLPYYHLFNHRSHRPAIELATKLAAVSPQGLEHVLFANSGSEANDQAVKLIWYYNNQRGRRQKKKLIGRHLGYHGVTTIAASLTGLPPVHADFDAPFAGFLHAPAASYYHGAAPGESEEQFVDRVIAETEELILREGPETIAAFFAEPVNGAGGVIIPPEGYFEKLQALLCRHDILFVVDEVITGFGRTGELFGSDTFGLRPDVLTVAKALSSAYLPISATLVSSEIYAALVEGSRKNGAFAHGFTYAAHPVSAAVALETLRIYEERDIVSHVKSVSRRFQERLRSLGNHPLVGETRGVGLLGAVELTSDKKNRKGFDSKHKLSALVQLKAQEHGIIVRGIRDAIAICPPLIITDEQIDELFDGLGRAIDDGLRLAREQGLLITG